MCGRYELNLSHEARAHHFAYEEWLKLLYDPVWATSQSFDVRPETLRPVAVANGQAPDVRAMRWGWHPTWMRAPLINCRWETVPTKPTFKTAFAARRCVVPATGYFEWQRDEKDKPRSKYLFRSGEGGWLRLAGLWESTEHKGVTESRFIVVTRPMVLYGHIHDRTPVVLSPAAADTWLDPRAPERDLLDAAGDLGDDHLIVRSVTFDKAAGKSDGPHLTEPLDGSWPWA
jgi:putative SOS response-associated peptidase YedK